MRENLPKEMDFQHEARNAERAEEDFLDVRTSLYIRTCNKRNAMSSLTSSIAKIVDARKRVLMMEYIRGGRVDDRQYLADHDIDRNTVSIELARIFAQMVHMNGWFHAVCPVRHASSVDSEVRPMLGSSPRYSLLHIYIHIDVYMSYRSSHIAQETF